MASLGIEVGFISEIRTLPPGSEWPTATLANVFVKVLVEMWPGLGPDRPGCQFQPLVC